MDLNVYSKAGMVLELVQKWEKEFKNVTIKYNIEKSDDKRSLSNMNSFLLRNNIINNEEYNLIKLVIEIRNMVIHRMFVDYENDYQKIESLTLMISDTINKSFVLFEKLIK